MREVRRSPCAFSHTKVQIARQFPSRCSSSPRQGHLATNEKRVKGKTLRAKNTLFLHVPQSSLRFHLLITGQKDPVARIRPSPFARIWPCRSPGRVSISARSPAAIVPVACGVHIRRRAEYRNDRNPGYTRPLRRYTGSSRLACARHRPV